MHFNTTDLSGIKWKQMCCKNKQKAVTKTIISTEEHNSFLNYINMGKCGKSVSFSKNILEFWKLNTVTLDALWENGWAFPFFLSTDPDTVWEAAYKDCPEHPQLEAVQTICI